MNILLLIDQIGPAEGMLLAALRREEHRVLAYNVGGWWMQGGLQAPAWLQAPSVRRSDLTRGYLAETIAEQNIDLVLSSGMAAGRYAAIHLSSPFLPLLWRSDLDFSSARQALVDGFHRLCGATDRLLLEDEWEMDKAAGKGSRVAHLVLPVPTMPAGAILASDLAGPRVAVVYAEGMPEERLRMISANLAAALEPLGAEVVPVRIDSLYSRRDLEGSRDVQRTLRNRLAGYSHVVLVGASRNSTAVLASLRHDWDRVAAEETIGVGNLARRIGFPQTARGQALVELVRGAVERWIRHGGTVQTPDVEQPEPFGAGLARQLEVSVDPDFEELAALEGEGPVNVFFAAAPLQDRQDGARPQRIRNMAEAFDAAAPTPAVRVFSHPRGFRRRLKLIRRALAAGRSAGYFYGENSTTPIESQDVIRELGVFLGEFRDAGGKTAWFVRDLHWLEDVDGYLDEPGQREAITRRGILELNEVGARADVLAAPCRQSGSAFRRLLAGHEFPDHEWYSLPPGVAASNVVEHSPAPEEGNVVQAAGSAATERAGAVPGSGADPGRSPGGTDGVTLLYAGGSGALYAMDTYLEALVAMPASCYFDFVVRPGEARYLRRQLERFGLDADSRVRITHVDLENYVPRTKRCVGAILLDSEYARDSFPYKTMSMLERGFPILTFDDMAIAEFVAEAGIGEACERSAAAIARTAQHLAGRADFRFAAARRKNGWDARIIGLMAELDRVRT